MNDCINLSHPRSCAWLESPATLASTCDILRNSYPHLPLIMRHNTSISYPEGEPLSKRLRSSKSQNGKAALPEKKQVLPSPRPTNPSSTDNITPSSSSIGRDPKPKPAQSFRDRLLPPPKEAAPFSAITGDPIEEQSRDKPSATPFFKRIEAAFHDKLPATKEANNHASTTTRASSFSSSPDPEDLINQLRGRSSQPHQNTHPPN